MDVISTVNTRQTTSKVLTNVRACGWWTQGHQNKEKLPRKFHAVATYAGPQTNRQRQSHNLWGEGSSNNNNNKKKIYDHLLDLSVWATELTQTEQSEQINKRQLLVFLASLCPQNRLCATLNANSNLPSTFFLWGGRTRTRDNPSPSCIRDRLQNNILRGNIKMHTDCLNQSPPASSVKKHLAVFNVSVGFLVGL